MAKKTATTKIKEAFERNGFGKSKDWKRLSKNKGAEGTLVRIFENVQSKEKLEVTEAKNGEFTMRPFVEGKSLNVNVEISDDVKSGLAPYIEKDPAKNAAADKIIQNSVTEKCYIENPDMVYVLADVAGKALANRYYCAVSKEDSFSGLDICTTPIEYFKNNGCLHDQTGPIHNLIPECSELAESMWEFNSGKVKDPVEAIRYMQERGFIWDKSFQDMVDSSLTNRIDKALKKSAPPKLNNKPNPKV